MEDFMPEKSLTHTATSRSYKNMPEFRVHDRITWFSPIPGESDMIAVHTGDDSPTGPSIAGLLSIYWHQQHPSIGFGEEMIFAGSGDFSDAQRKIVSASGREIYNAASKAKGVVEEVVWETTTTVNSPGIGYGSTSPNYIVQSHGKFASWS